MMVIITIMKGLIIIVAAGIKQEHGGSRWLAVIDPDSKAPDTPAKNGRREERDEQGENCSNDLYRPVGVKLSVTCG